MQFTSAIHPGFHYKIWLSRRASIWRAKLPGAREASPFPKDYEHMPHTLLTAISYLRYTVALDAWAGVFLLVAFSGERRSKLQEQQSWLRKTIESLSLWLALLAKAVTIQPWRTSETTRTDLNSVNSASSAVSMFLIERPRNSALEPILHHCIHGGQEDRLNH